MAQHNDFGKQAEEMACQYLKEKEYEILERNYTYLHYEIDIIAKKGNIIVVVEVKARKSAAYGEPYTFVDKTKIKNLTKAIDFFIRDKNIDAEVRFDIISIVKNKNIQEITHIKDAFCAIG